MKLGASFKLLRLETGFLKGTVLLIGLILTVFCAAFLSVLSVYFDVPAGLYSYLENKNESKNKLLVICHPDTDIATAEARCDTWAYGTRAGLTTDVTLKGSKSYTVNPQEGKTEYFTAFGTNATSTRGFALTPADAGKIDAVLGEIRTAGAPLAHPGELVCTTIFTSRLGAKLGEEVLVGDRTFTLVGIYDSSNIWDYADDVPLPLCSFYLCVDENEPMDFCYSAFDSAEQMHAESVRLREEGVHIEVMEAILSAFSNINLTKAFFGAIALVLGIMVLFIVYSLIAMFYRQRRGQICRMRLLGGRTSTIARTYCTIAILLSVAAVVLGAVGSIAFNLFFMDLCTTLFETTFTSNFRIVWPAALLGILVLFVLLLYADFNRKIRNAHIAQEVKHE